MPSWANGQIGANGAIVATLIRCNGAGGRARSMMTSFFCDPGSLGEDLCG